MERARGFSGIFILPFVLAGCSGDPATGNAPETGAVAPSMQFHVRDENGNPLAGTKVMVCAYEGNAGPACDMPYGTDSAGTYSLWTSGNPGFVYSFEVIPPAGYSYASSNDCPMQMGSDLGIWPGVGQSIHELKGDQDALRLSGWADGRTAKIGSFSAYTLSRPRSCTLVMQKMKYAWAYGNADPAAADTSPVLRIPAQSLGIGTRSFIFKAYAGDSGAVYDTTRVSLIKWDAALERGQDPIAKGVREKLGFRIAYQGLDDHYSFYAIFRPKDPAFAVPENMFGLDSALIPEWGRLFGYRKNIAWLGQADLDSGTIARTVEILPPDRDGYRGMVLEVGLIRDLSGHSPLFSRFYSIDLD